LAVLLAIGCLPKSVITDTVITKSVTANPLHRWCVRPRPKGLAALRIERRPLLRIELRIVLLLGFIVIPTAAAFDSFWDSQIGEVLIRCLLLREEQHRWVERLGSYGLI
jgi:hypothetical protein